MSRALLALALGALAVGTPGSAEGCAESIPVSVIASPLTVTLSVLPAQIGRGRTARAVATVTNLGSRRVDHLTLALRSDQPRLGVAGPDPVRLSSLAPGARATGRWTVCGRVPASYVLVAQARGSLPSGATATAESEARTLAVTGPPACRRRPDDRENGRRESR